MAYSDTDTTIGRDIGLHAAQTGLDKMADIVQTAGTKPQKVVAAAVATALMLSRLQASILIMDEGKPDGEFANMVHKLIAEVLPGFKEEALGQAEKMKAKRRHAD